MKKQIIIIDYAKFFFCTCIVMLHTNLLSGCPDFLKFAISSCVFRVAVPFFFISSGYFLMQKISNSHSLYSVFKDYISRLAKPLIIFGVLYAIIETKKMQLLYNITLSSSIDFFIKSLFVYQKGGIWYLSATIVAAIIIYLAIKFHKTKYLILLGSVLYFIGLLDNNYYFLIKNSQLESLLVNYNNVFINARNGIFVGLLYLSLGMLSFNIIVKKETCLKYSLLCFILLFFEVAFLFRKPYIDDRSLFVFMPFFSFYLYNYLIRLNLNSRKFDFAYLLRKLSLSIYLLHYLFLCSLDLLAIIKGIQLPAILNFIIVYSISIMVSLLIYKKGGTLSRFIS